ncbi:MAG: 6-bladed beta-propeller [Candidatus Aminicenantes bacterium]|nr:6-bladed beta-propeller [Candidatus Aminicenantes bacterium]
MKKAFCLVNILIFLLCCSPKQENVERIIENGVEVIINHLEPYDIKGEPSTLNLEEDFTIDLEQDDIAKLGLADILFWFDVDSEGNIYLLDSRGSSGIWVFKFNKSGNYVSSFGRKGEGPGEFHKPNVIRVTNEDEIAIIDQSRKLAFLDKEGNLIKEIRLSSTYGFLDPLNQERFLMLKTIQNPSEDISTEYSLFLCGEELEELQELAVMEIPNPLVVKRLDGVLRIPIFTITEKSFLLWDPNKGYEIAEYDFEGKLLRKIRKDYKPVEVSEEYKKGFLKLYDSPNLKEYRKMIYFPKNLPPLQFFFVDEKGYLFVMTFEKGDTPKAILYDVFNKDGVFITRIQLENISIQDLREVTLNVMALNGRIYCLQEKESGYKELVVYKMRWE